MSSPFYAPLAAIITLIAVVWCIAVMRRVREVRERRIPLQSLARARDTAATLNDTQAIDNFNNLLQVPPLFCVLCLALAQVGESGIPLIAGAWLYVALRVTHSTIQLTHNRVIQRFYAWTMSNLVLFALWGTFAIKYVIRA